MSFDFSITTQNLQGASSPQVNTQTSQGVGSTGFFSINGAKIVHEKQVDSFTKTPAQFGPQIRQASSFASTYQKYYNAQVINNALNSTIQNICDKHQISSHVTPEQVINIDKSHLEKTYEYSMMIGNRMQLTPQEKEDLKTGAILHDIGKAYMPGEILNKPGRLTDDERAVINSHSELGGEVARQLGANENVVDMIANHHAQTTDNKLCSILQVADRYSALTQKRAYKNPYSPALTFKILEQEVQEGKLSGEALNALKQAINSQNNFYNKVLIRQAS